MNDKKPISTLIRWGLASGCFFIGVAIFMELIQGSNETENAYQLVKKEISQRLWTNPSELSSNQYCDSAKASTAPNSDFEAVPYINKHNEIVSTRIQFSPSLEWMNCPYGMSPGFDANEVTKCEVPKSFVDLKVSLSEVKDILADRHLASSGYRLPTVSELLSIVETSCVNPAINLNVFPGTPADTFWATADKGADYFAVNFKNGQLVNASQADRHFARLVRVANGTHRSAAEKREILLWRTNRLSSTGVGN